MQYDLLVKDVHGIETILKSNDSARQDACYETEEPDAELNAPKRIEQLKDNRHDLVYLQFSKR
ncbi:MAG: hypothetical protein ACREBU_04340 [Nitrososphaera sp.]